jgi:CubicO group peptidase (beta-lactamase class C family)
MSKSYLRQRTALRPLACAVVILGFLTTTPSHSHDQSEEPIGTALQVYDGLLTPDVAVATFRNTDRLFATREIAIGTKPHELPMADKQLEQVKFKSNGKDYDLFDYLSLNRVSGVMVLKDGKIAYELYQYGNTPDTRWMSMSMAKSFTSTLVGAAVQDGLLNIKDPVTKYVPSLKGSAYEGVTVRDMLMFASGVYWSEESGEAAGKMNPKTPRRQLLDIQIAQKPGATMALMRTLPRVAPIGSVMEYSTGEAQVQVEVLRAAIKKPLSTYLSEKIWANFGMEYPANWWLDSPNGSEIGGSGISATLRDYARFGLFIMNNGMVGDRRVLPEGWAADAGSAKIASVAGEPINYGYNWWIPSSGPSRADGAFEARGKGGQGIYINQKEKIVIAITSAQIKGNAPIANGDFYDAVVAALK